jgi:hypothetical protein
MLLETHASPIREGRAGLSNQRRIALGLGAATLIGAAVIGTVIGRGTETNQPVVNGAGTTAHPDTAPISPARHHSGWIFEANRVCRLGRKLYPSIALGADVDPDTMDYVTRRLVDEIMAITDPPATPVRMRLARTAGAATSAWLSLATRPIGEVTQRERREAERLTAGYVDELVGAGAGACAPLRPAGA